MTSSTRRLGRVGTTIVSAGVFATLLASPAWAHTSQWPDCEFFETGHTYWKYAVDPDYSALIPFHGVWRPRDGRLVASQQQGPLPLNGGDKFEIYGEGSNDWALFEVVVENGGDGSIQTRGWSCDGGDASGLLVAQTPPTNVGVPAPAMVGIPIPADIGNIHT